MTDCSITYGGGFEAGAASESATTTDLLRELREEAEHRGWPGAAILKAVRSPSYLQIEIVPAQGWRLDLADLALVVIGEARREEAK